MLDRAATLSYGTERSAAAPRLLFNLRGRLTGSVHASLLIVVLAPNGVVSSEVQSRESCLTILNLTRHSELTDNPTRGWIRLHYIQYREVDRVWRTPSYCRISVKKKYNVTRK